MRRVEAVVSFGCFQMQGRIKETRSAQAILGYTEAERLGTHRLSLGVPEEERAHPGGLRTLAAR